MNWAVFAIYQVLYYIYAQRFLELLARYRRCYIHFKWLYIIYDLVWIRSTRACWVDFGNTAVHDRRLARRRFPNHALSFRPPVLASSRVPLVQLAASPYLARRPFVNSDVHLTTFNDLSRLVTMAVLYDLAGLSTCCLWGGNPASQARRRCMWPLIPILTLYPEIFTVYTT